MELFYFINSLSSIGLSGSLQVATVIFKGFLIVFLPPFVFLSKNDDGQMNKSMMMMKDKERLMQKSNEKWPRWEWQLIDKPLFLSHSCPICLAEPCPVKTMLISPDRCWPSGINCRSIIPNAINNVSLFIRNCFHLVFKRSMCVYCTYAIQFVIIFLFNFNVFSNPKYNTSDEGWSFSSHLCMYYMLYYYFLAVVFVHS